VNAALQRGTTSDDTSISPAAMEQIEALLREKESRTPAQQKIDSQLLYANRMRRGELIAAGVESLDTGIEYDHDGRFEVDISTRVTNRVLRNLESAGVSILYTSKEYHTIRALVPGDQLERIAGWPDVSFIQPKAEATTSGNGGQDPADYHRGVSTDLPRGFAERAERIREFLPQAIAARAGSGGIMLASVGSQSSQGDVTHKAAAARSTFGVTGAGIKIGVLSDGVTNLAASQALGDLGPVTVLPGQTGSGDEGTAMLEIVHDLAPGAQLFFATAFTSITSFAQNIRDLRTAGCDIIVDDVFYFVETPMQDGQVAPVVSNTNGGVVIQAVNDVTAAGAMYFSSAGNSGNKNDATSGVWEGDFVDGGPTGSPIPVGSAGNFHNFGGQSFNTLTTAGSGPINLYWSDPLGGSSNDYDLFRLNAAGTTLAASSTNIQNGTQDPYEQITQSTANPRIVIVKKTGALGRFLHLNTNRGRLSISTTGQTHGHSCAANAFGVAATPASNFAAPPNPSGPFPNPFNSSNTVELFSSDGLRRVFFNPDSSPITPGDFSSTGGLLRQKPDITAADGVSVTGVGGFGSPFFGTSAAAPHAAAIAALIKSGNPALTPAQIRTALTTSSIDIEAAGVDRDSGAGIIMAFEALQAAGIVGGANPEIGTVTAAESPGNANGFIEAGEGATLTVQVKNTGVAAATSISAALTTSTAGVVITQPNTSPYPDIPVGGSATNSTPFRFTLASNVPCPLNVDFTLTITLSGALSSPRVLTFTVPTGSSPLTISSTLDATPPVAGSGFTTATGSQTARLNRNGVSSTCAGKANPGVTGTGTRQYDSYTFTSCSSAPSCVTATLVNACTGANPAMLAAAYTGSFNPASVTTNYLGDPGSSQIAAGPSSFSFTVAAGATFVLVVSEVNQGLALGCNYTLTISGVCISCPTANQLPIASCQNVTVAAGPSCTANASIDNGSSDPEGGPLTITQTPAGPYPLGTTSVLLTVTDNKGATTQCTANVTVVDQTPPGITCPSNIIIPAAPGTCSAVATFTATAADNCPPSPTVVCSPPSGSTFPKGTTTVTCTATDGSGNTASCSFTVKVNDTQPPTIACPPSMILQAPPGASSFPVTFPSPVISDNCSGASVVCVPPSGSAFAPGTTTVNCTATDASGNTAGCSFTVTTVNIVVRDDATGVFIKFFAPPASGVVPYTFVDCAKGIVYNGTGRVTITSCKIELNDPFGSDKTATRSISVLANPCTKAGTAQIKLPGSSSTYNLNDVNIGNNPLNCP
ncbi:MAG TPA: HYR domain-containing protein, partial [Blastocatellia bacterium]|nr:HYR domain-containing protein [Blastocatellia bacterium]